MANYSSKEVEEAICAFEVDVGHDVQPYMFEPLQSINQSSFNEA